MKSIKLGYEINTGKVVNIKPSHLIVTGVTQLSGKTTTLEALVKRSEQKVIIFRTKIGEASFTEGMDKNAVVYPYLKDRIKALLGIHEASEVEINAVYDHVMSQLIES